MNEQKIEGLLIKILEVESGVSKSGSDWKKQDFLIETTDKYPKTVCFTLFGDKISLLNGFSEGNTVNVSYNIVSRDFNGKWFHNVTAWKIEKIETGSQTTGSPNNYQTVKASEPTTSDDYDNDYDNDSLPF